MHSLYYMYIHPTFSLWLQSAMLSMFNNSNCSSHFHNSNNRSYFTSSTRNLVENCHGQ